MGQVRREKGKRQTATKDVSAKYISIVRLREVLDEPAVVVVREEDVGDAQLPLVPRQRPHQAGPRAVLELRSPQLSYERMS